MCSPLRYMYSMKRTRALSHSLMVRGRLPRCLARTASRAARYLCRVSSDTRLRRRKPSEVSACRRSRWPRRRRRASACLRPSRAWSDVGGLSGEAADDSLAGRRLPAAGPLVGLHTPAGRGIGDGAPARRHGDGCRAVVAPPSVPRGHSSQSASHIKSDRRGHRVPLARLEVLARSRGRPLQEVADAGDVGHQAEAARAVVAAGADRDVDGLAAGAKQLPAQRRPRPARVASRRPHREQAPAAATCSQERQDLQGSASPTTARRAAARTAAGVRPLKPRGAEVDSPDLPGEDVLQRGPGVGVLRRVPGFAEGQRRRHSKGEQDRRRRHSGRGPRSFHEQAPRREFQLRCRARRYRRAPRRTSRRRERLLPGRGGGALRDVDDPPSGDGG